MSSRNLIHILHHQRDEIIGWVDEVYTDSHHQHLGFDEKEKYDFEVSAFARHVEKIQSRSRFIIPGEGKGIYHEFILWESRDDTEKNIKEFRTYPSYKDLNNLKSIPSQVLEGQTIRSAANYVLEGLIWEIGTVEYSGIRKWVIEKQLGGFDALVALSTLFGCELRFRIEINGNKVTGRYVDFLKRQGEDRGNEIEFHKDLIGIRRTVNNDKLVTALLCIGPKQENGENLTVIVKDEEAFQNWNWRGQHLIQTYEPQSNDEDMTEEELRQLGETELKKRISAAVQYEVSAESLQKWRLGDTARIKDERFNPPMYLESRVISIFRSIFDDSQKDFTLGEVIEHKKEDIFRVWKDLQALYATKVIKSPTPPEGRINILWVKTGGKIDVVYTWDSAQGKWVKASAEIPEDIGTYSQEDIDNKDQATFEDGTYYADQVAQNAEDNAKQHTETYAIDRTTYTQKIQDIENELTEKVSKLLYDNNLATLQQDIAAKAGLEYVNGQLVSKADKSNTFTKTEVENQLNSKVSTTKYTTDQDGVVTQLTNHESRINQTEDGLTSKVSQTSYNQKVSTLETQISQANTLIQQNSNQIQLKASKSELDTLKGRVSGTESSLSVQAELIESKVSQVEFDGLEIGGRNLLLDSAKDRNTTRFVEVRVNDILSPYVGEDIAVSFEIKAQYARNIQVYPYQNNGITIQDTVVFMPSTTEFKRCSFVTKVVQAGSNPSYTPGGIGFYDYAGNNNYTIRNIKIERGNKPTSYTEAPEDIQSKIDTINGRMSSAETKITQNTAAINLKASQSTVDSLAGRVSNTEASIQVQSGLIESKVSKTEFQSLEYGIRNLIRNSKGDTLEGFKWWGSTVTTLTNFNNATWIRVNKSSVNNQVGIHTTPFNMKANKTYIISFDIKSMYNVGYDLNYLFLRYIDSNGNVITVKSIPGVNMRTGFTGDISGNGLRVWFPVSHTSDISNATILIAVSGVSEGAGFALKEIKVEEGTRPTSWTPAPEDTQEQINNAEERVTSAESSITQLSNQIQTKVSENGVISSINQTAEIIKIAASKIQFEGAIFGQNARFAGSIVSTDGSNTLKIDGDSISINDRDIFDSESTLPSMYDGNLSFPIVSAYGKMYLQEITFSIPSGTHSPGAYIEKTLNISNYTRVAIPKVLGFFCHAVAKEWYAYENDSTRVYGGTDIMSTKIRISPHYQYTSGGSSVKVYIMIVGYR
ncbi:hypothetical protein HF072_00565 [Bacillus sp. RO3]|nr:hypothetical protein [Bacillus sp. RO3]